MQTCMGTPAALQRHHSWPTVHLFEQPALHTRAHGIQSCCGYSRVLRTQAQRRFVHGQPLAPVAHAATRSRRQVVAQAAWNAHVDFHTAKVISNKVVGTDLHELYLDVGDTVVKGYTKPGQFLQAKLSLDGKAGFFALASPPGTCSQGVVELLVRSTPGSPAEALCGLPAGSPLHVSGVMGGGFPLDRIPPEEVPHVLMFATGSGISPIKAVIESGVLNVPQRSQVTLYYGTKDEDSTAYRELVPGWEAAGVRVVHVFSEQRQRYVQTVFAQDAGHITDPSRVGVLLCGHKAMCTSITDLLTQQGVDKSRILLNF